MWIIFCTIIMFVNVHLAVKKNGWKFPENWNTLKYNRHKRLHRRKINWGPQQVQDDANIFILHYLWSLLENPSVASFVYCPKYFFSLIFKYWCIWWCFDLCLSFHIFLLIQLHSSCLGSSITDVLMYWNVLDSKLALTWQPFYMYHMLEYFV